MCGLTADGIAYCWGSVPGPTTSLPATTPVAVTTAVHFLALSVALYHACGVGTDSVAYCWGFNNVGEVGPMFVSTVSTPTAVLRP